MAQRQELRRKLTLLSEKCLLNKNLNARNDNIQEKEKYRFFVEYVDKYNYHNFRFYPLFCILLKNTKFGRLDSVSVFRLSPI
jgi:hypothetical protein